ncbi:MAG: GIY-YIG nuclease family protein [Myxococcota bacterium]
MGVTNNLIQRLWQHQQDILDHSKTFVSKYNCCHLVYWEHFQNVQHAIAREKELKGWRRDKEARRISPSIATRGDPSSLRSSG